MSGLGCFELGDDWSVFESDLTAEIDDFFAT